MRFPILFFSRKEVNVDMAMVKPVLSQILPIDSTVDNIINFSSVGGSQVYKNKIIIKKSSDNTEVYNNTVTSFEFKHTIPASTLTNGVSYTITVTTYDVDNNASLPSDSVLFYCFATPTISITNIVDSKINAQDFIFQGEYSGTNIDTLQSYRYILYDTSQNLLESFSEVYSTVLTQEVDGLKNGTDYYIQLLCIGQHGREYKTDLIKFTPNFITPLLSATLTLTNNNDKGSINVLGNVVEANGVIKSGAISYSDGWVDLKTGNATIEFSEGVMMENNFVLKLFAKNIEDDVDIIKIVFGNGYLEIVKSNNRIHCYKNLNNSTLMPSHFASSLVEMTEVSNLVIWLKSINGLIDVIVEVLS